MDHQTRRPYTANCSPTGFSRVMRYRSPHLGTHAFTANSDGLLVVKTTTSNGHRILRSHMTVPPDGSMARSNAAESPRLGR